MRSSILNLASTHSYESDLKRFVEELNDGKLYFNSLSVGQRPTSLWRRENNRLGLQNRVRSTTNHPVRFRSPKDYRLFPEFRRSLQSWIRNLYFQPEVISDLKNLVKRPLDLHYAANGSVPVNSLYKSSAVVGNCGILLKGEYGQFIDSHEMVIKLNNARTQGYSRYVGSKTTLSFVNSNILQLCARIVKYYSIKRFVEETGKVPEDWGKIHDEKAFHYSSGMQAVLLAVGICEKVSIFGFGKSGETKHHYHTNQKKRELDLHDYEAEYVFYKDLVEQPEL